MHETLYTKNKTINTSDVRSCRRLNGLVTSFKSWHDINGILYLTRR